MPYFYVLRHSTRFIFDEIWQNQTYVMCQTDERLPRDFDAISMQFPIDSRSIRLKGATHEGGFYYEKNKRKKKTEKEKRKNESKKENEG